MNPSTVSITLGQDRRFTTDTPVTAFGYLPDSDGQLSITELPRLLDQLAEQNIRCQLQRQIGPAFGWISSAGDSAVSKIWPAFLLRPSRSTHARRSAGKAEKDDVRFIRPVGELNPNRPALVCCSNNMACDRLFVVRNWPLTSVSVLQKMRWKLSSIKAIRSPSSIMPFLHKSREIPT